MPIVRKFRNIESTGKIKKGKKERYVSIAETMLLNKNYLSLSSSAKTLYTYMKYWSAGREQIEYSSSMSKKYMSKPTFLKARDELEEKGFIVTVNCGKFNKTTNIYRFSNKWYNNDT